MKKIFFGSHSVFLLSLLIWSSVGRADTTCSSLFDSRGDKAKGIDSKFNDVATKNAVMNVLRFGIWRPISVEIETRDLDAVGEGPEAAGFFGRLIDRGLLVKPLERNRMRLTGYPDLVFAAFRHSAVAKVSGLDTARGLQAIGYPLFARLPGTDRSKWKNNLPAKFERHTDFQNFKWQMMTHPDKRFRVTLAVENVIRAPGLDLQFLFGLFDLGLAVYLESTKPAPGQSAIELTGTIESIFSVMRHPSVMRVMSFHTHGSSEIPSPERSAQAEILRDAFAPEYRDVLRTVDLHRDPDLLSLVRLEPIDPKAVVIAHEARTARDYASFLGAKYGQDFAYVSDFRGHTVPIFDGLVLDRKNHHAIANVSLKYAETRLAHYASYPVLRELRNRVADLDMRVIEARSQKSWMLLAQAVPKDIWQLAAGSESRKRTDRGLFLKRLFGMFPIEKKGDDHRQMRLVVDFRDHGIPFNYFTNADLHEEMRLMVKEMPVDGTTLTLLWNEHQVIEISSAGVAVHR